MTTDYLSYGDKICLYCENTNGYITSNCSSSYYNDLRILSQQDKFNPNHISDIQQIVFEVIIPNRYKLYKKYVKTYGPLMKDGSTGPRKQLDLENKLMEEQARASVTSEENDNALEQKRNLGKQVHYGDIVQLRHLYTKKYVHVNSSKMSSLDKNSMKLVLESHNSKSAQFKILPRYKVKYEGEIVQYMDLVTFESIKAPLHYFHSSELTNLDYLFYGAELNLSVDQSGFSLVRSSKSVIRKDDQNDFNQHTKITLQAGDYVQLVHKEIDGYIESWGTFKSEVKPEVNLRLRELRKTASSTNYRLSSSASTFWQIEQEKVSLSTEEGRWTENYRFRHATNRMYLCIKDGSTKVSLSRKPRVDTVFKLHPQSSDLEGIRYGNVFRLEHVLSGTWVHGKRNQSEDDDAFSRNQNDHDEISLANLKWDHHNYKELEGVKQRLYDDAFVIYQVSSKHVESFNKLSGYEPLLQNILLDRQEKVPYAASQSYQLKVALEEIRDDLTCNGEPMKFRQKHLRNLELVDLLVQLVLTDFFSELDEAFSKKIYRAAYEILHNYMKGSSRKNSLYFAKYIDFFIPKMLENDDLGRKITEMITELVKDNERVLECIKFENIVPFIDSLRKNQNPRFLEYLMKFCVCNNQPLVVNQTKIATKWLTEDLDGVYQTDRGQNINLQTNVIYIKTGFNKEWEPLHEFLDENHPGFNKDSKDYFLKQIDLLLALCNGRNIYCIDLIINRLNYVSWEECFAAIQSDLLPYYMKTKYFEIIETMFIDIGTNYAVIDSPKYNFSYQQIHGDHPIAVECMFPIPTERITNRIFDNLMNWIFDFLELQPCMLGNEVDLNYLTEIVLNLSNKMIQYGYFNTNNISRMLESLLRILNGKLDLPFDYDSKKESSKHRKKLVLKFRNKLRYEDSLENQAIVCAKLAGLEVLQSILTYERVSVVSQLISKFKKCDRPDSKIQKHRRIGHTHLIECLEESFDIDQHYKSSPRSAKKMVQEIDQIFQKARFINPDLWKSILLDLAYYKSGNMNQKSLLILHKLYTIKEASFNDTYTTFISNTVQSRELQEKLCDYIPQLKLITKSAITSEHIPEINQMINQMISVCRISKSNDIFNPISQRIIIGYGILDLSFDIITQVFRSFEKERRRSRKSQLPSEASGLVVKVTELLRHLAVSNSSFQEDLFNRFDILLDLYSNNSTAGVTSMSSTSTSPVAGFSHPPEELAHLLRQGIFHNNRSFCGRIKPYQLNRLIQIVARTARSQPQVGGAFVQLLESLACINDGQVPLKRNQLLIMKFLMKSYSQIVYVLDSKNNDTIALLSAKSSFEDAQYFNRIVDLFVACCQGENQYVQSLCQTIIPLEELLKLLTSSDVHETFKRGLLRYLCKVYLSKISIVNQEGAVKNFLGSKFFDELLNSVQSSIDKTQFILQKSNHFNLLPLFKRPFLVKPPSQKQIAENVQMYLQNTIYGTSIFMASFSGAISLLGFQMTPPLQARVKSINKKILEVFSTIFKFQLPPSIISLMTESLLQILPFSGLTEMESKSLLSMHCKPKILDRDPRKEIDELYSKEIELNLKLKTFLFNCSMLVSGRNTVKAQLGLNINKPYIDARDQTALPLSLDFQKHLQAFLQTNVAHGEFKRYRHLEVILRQLENSGHYYMSSNSRSYQGQYIRKQDQDGLDLRCLQILRALIYNEDVQLPKDWESRLLDQSVQDSLKNIRQVQTNLNKLNVSSRSQLHMVNPCDAVRKEVVILLSAVLMNANVQVQETMLRYFLTAKDEVFFGAIKQQLQEAFDDLKDQKLMAVTKQIMFKIDNIKILGESCDINLVELRDKLLKQMLGYEERYSEYHQSLAINESFTMRKLRQLTASQPPINQSMCCNQSNNNNQSGSSSCCCCFGTRRSDNYERHDELQLSQPSIGAHGNQSTVTTVVKDSNHIPRVSIVEEGDANYDAGFFDMLQRAGEEFDLEEVVVKNDAPRGSITSGNNNNLHSNTNYHHRLSSVSQLDIEKISVNNYSNTSEQLSLSDSRSNSNSSLQQQHDLAALARGDPQQQVKLVLELLSRMCVGQYYGLQNYLRCQPDNQASVDVISLVVHFLGNIYANINPTTIDLNVLAFDTIKEAILGNQENRSVVYRAKVVDYANFILRSDDIVDSCENRKLLNLYSVIGRVIFALIEENGSEESELVNEIKMTLDVKAVYKVMSYCHRLIENTKDKAKHEKIFDIGFNYFLILARFEDLDKGKTLRDCQPTDLQIKAFRFFKKGASSIEILKNGELQRIYFRLRNKEVLRESVREKVKWEVDRTTPSNKIRSFISWSKLIIPDMSFQRKIISNQLLLFFTKKWDLMNYLMTILSVIICILLLVGVRAPVNGYIGLKDPDPKLRSPEFDRYEILYKDSYPLFKSVIIGLGVAHSVICLMILLTYLITDRPTPKTLLSYYNTIKNYVVGLVTKVDYNDESVATTRSTNVSLFSISRFLYCCLCLGLSIYGFWQPYVFAFHLFNIIHNNQLLKGVIASVTTNGRVLIWVMILMVIVMYIFAIVAFCLFRSMLNSEKFLYSGSLVQTFVTIIRFGIVGDLFENMVPADEEKTTINQAFGRFSSAIIFHLVFFIVITITGLNIVFGIIVDSFSELRDDKFKAERDMKDMCFICSRPGHDFDQTRIGFNQHVVKEHNMWSYLFYFLQLKEKKISDYYHLDLYVSNMLKKENYDFFPINRALALTTDERELSQVDDICRNVKMVTEYRRTEDRENRQKLQMLQNRLWHRQNQSRTSGSVSPVGSMPNSTTNDQDLAAQPTGSIANALFQRLNNRFKSPINPQ